VRTSPQNLARGDCNADPTDCVLCPGEDAGDLPTSCGGSNACPGGETPCTAGGSECGNGEYCQSGCCIGNIE
jgi:hypothetical protein